MTFKQRFMRRFSKAQDGAVVIFIALVIGTLVSATGIAFEMSRYTKAKSRFVHALDQALLAAASSGLTGEPAKAYASRYFNSNLAGEGANVTVLTFNITNNSDRTQWTGSATGSIDTLLASIIGVGQIDVSHEAQVTWATNQNVEIVAMLDVSGTMCSTFRRVQADGVVTEVTIEPDPSCFKLDQMERALEHIIDIGVGFSHLPGQPLYRVGILPYSYKLRLPHPENVPSFLLDAESNAGYGRDYYTNIADAEASGPPLPPVTPLTGIGSEQDKEALRAQIRNIATADHQEVNRAFIKRSTIGAVFSGMMLDPAYHNIFGGIQPAPIGDPNTRKVVILMTDSANLGCCYTNWPPGNFQNHYTYSYKADHDALLRDDNENSLCSIMKREAGIEIFTVLFDVNPSDLDARGQEIIDAFRICSTSEGTDELHFHMIPGRNSTNRYGENTEQALERAYDIIGRSLMNLRLSY